MENHTLAGKRILLTRAREQIEEIAARVRAQGGIPLPFPCLAVECLTENIIAAGHRLDEFSDVLFTSANGVHCAAHALGNLSDLLNDKRVAVVGKSTAAALAEHGVRADIVPATASQEGLVEAYSRHGLPKSLLFFRAKEGRELLADALAARGVRVETVAAYKTVCPEEDAPEVLGLLQNHAVDAVLLGSSKAARHYCRRIGDIDLANRPIIVVISHQVAETASQEGLNVQIVTETASFDAMLAALAEYFA